MKWNKGFAPKAENAGPYIDDNVVHVIVGIVYVTFWVPVCVAVNQANSFTNNYVFNRKGQVK